MQASGQIAKQIYLLSQKPALSEIRGVGKGIQFVGHNIVLTIFSRLKTLENNTKYDV